MAGRLLVQRRGGVGSRALAERFRQVQRPLWLATGAAWTGLDLSADGDPGEDRLLTDLVIVRAPMSIDVSGYGLFSQISDASQMRLRQGVGRLVRSEGVRDRHLWVLDGRYWMAEHRLIARSGRAVLDGYGRREPWSDCPGADPGKRAPGAKTTPAPRVIPRRLSSATPVVIVR